MGSESLICYVELNPVRAAMVDHAAEYPWSSYQYNAVGKPIKLITPHALYLQLGKAPEQTQAYYRSLFDTQSQWDQSRMGPLGILCEVDHVHVD